MDEYPDIDIYESGPYCIHWGEMGECDIMCPCGHTCTEHDSGYSSCRNCDCKKFAGRD